MSKEELINACLNEQTTIQANNDSPFEKIDFAQAILRLLVENFQLKYEIMNLEKQIERKELLINSYNKFINASDLKEEYLQFIKNKISNNPN